MSERKDKTMLASLTALREELTGETSENGASSVSLRQAFDRLYLGYQNGQYTDVEAERGISEIRGQMTASAPALPLMPSHRSRRDEILSRNYRDLADRLLSQPVGSWDMRHVEIVQGAISHLAESDSVSARTSAQQLQDRMSDSVWAGGLELSETVSELRSEAEDIRRSLIETLSERNFEPETMQPEDEPARTYAAEEASSVQKAVEQAQLRALRTRMSEEASSLKTAKVYVDQLARRVSEEQRRNTERDAAAFKAQADARIREASRRMIESEYNRLAGLYRQAVASSRSELNAGNIKVLSDNIDLIAHADIQHMTSSEIASQLASVRNSLGAFSTSENVQKVIREVRASERRVAMLSEMMNVSAEMPADKADDDARTQYLEARLLFEQKRMQFERSAEYDGSSSDMLKALDFEVQTPVFEVKNTDAYRQALADIQRVRQISQSASAGDIGLYAPSAGAEYVKNAGTALRQADAAAPEPVRMPTMQSALARRTNKLLNDVKQLAYMPSVRADMGFAAPKQRMENAAKPLFKRIRFSENNSEANALLPSLYKVSGLRLDSKLGSSPLRKSYQDLDLRGANFELVKIIEHQFDNRDKGRQTDDVFGANLDSSQRKDASNSAYSESLGIISDWMSSRRDSRRHAADTQSQIKTGRMKGAGIETALKGESMHLPKSVQDKLSPFLNFDLSQINIYAGPVAAMASEAMGAHAFTLGKNVFLGANKLDFTSAEGLGLLAHELLHTTHFDSGRSVDSKEQEAEAMEARVKNAFGSGGNPTLAVEKDTGSKKNGMTDQRSTLDGKPKAGTVGARYAYDPDFIFNYVCDEVMERLIEEMDMEHQRNGD